MKSKEELNALKKEIEDLNEKCRELTEEELKEVTGGVTAEYIYMPLVSIIQPIINSSDIASMKVLKDASSTAIYGSQGSNGLLS